MHHPFRERYSNCQVEHNSHKIDQQKVTTENYLIATSAYSLILQKEKNKEKKWGYDLCKAINEFTSKWKISQHF